MVCLFKSSQAPSHLYTNLVYPTQMVWEQETTLIIMLTLTTEAGKVCSILDTLWLKWGQPNLFTGCYSFYCIPQ